MVSLDLQPTLIGEKVMIRPVTPEDWSGLYRAASDPDIWKVHPVPTRYKEDEFRMFFDGAIAAGTAFCIFNNDDEIIGSSRYYGYNAELKEIEIGWTFIAVNYWGGTYNAEIKKLMLNHAFGLSGRKAVECVVFWVGEQNIRSRKAMEKLGASLRQGIHTRKESGDIPYVIYQITRSDWLKRR